MRYGYAAILAAMLMASTAVAQTSSGSPASQTTPPPGTASAGQKIVGSEGIQGKSGTESGEAAQGALSSHLVRQIQWRLHNQGLYSKQPSGVWDQDTKNAVESFQDQHDLNATGQLDGQTLAALGIGTFGSQAMGAYNAGGSQLAQGLGGQGQGFGQFQRENPNAVFMAGYNQGMTQGFAQGFRQAERLIRQRNQNNSNNDGNMSEDYNQ